MHGCFGLSVSILPLPKPQGTAQGCISQLSNSVLPFPPPEMDLTVLRFSRTDIGGHFSSMALQALSQTVCWRSPAPGQLFGHLERKNACVPAPSLSQPCQHSSGIGPSLCSWVNEAEMGFYVSSITEMGSSS